MARTASEKHDRPETRMGRQPSGAKREEPISTGVAVRYAWRRLKRMANNDMNVVRANEAPSERRVRFHRRRCCSRTRREIGQILGVALQATVLCSSLMSKVLCCIHYSISPHVGAYRRNGEALRTSVLELFHLASHARSQGERIGCSRCKRNRI